MIITACNEEDPITPPPSTAPSNDPLAESSLTEYEKDVVDYFNDIALGFEFGNVSRITRKWASPMKVYISGNVTEEIEEELNEIIAELDSLITDDFTIELVDDLASSNYHIFIGSGGEYTSLYPEVGNLTESNWGLFYLYWDARSNLINGHMYVDSQRADEVAQLHLLREEFTQSLGLARDATTYSNSIFQQSWTTTTSYAQIDKDIIRLLYHPDVSSGLTESRVTPILIQILED